MSGKYQTRYADWQRDPVAFWQETAQALSWSVPPKRILADDNPPFHRWFEGGEFNSCYNAVDRHVENGRADQTALIFDSAMQGKVERYSFADLQSEVAKLAGAIASLGVTKGDRVIIYMPMVPQAVFAMLACARLGAVHSVVFGGFAAAELAKRIDDAEPKLIMTASCGLEPNRVVEYKPLLDEAIDLSSHKPDHCLLLQRPQCKAQMREARDLDWEDVLSGAAPVDCVDVKATDPLYILYTSGTTGVPKGVVRDNGGHAAALTFSMQYVYGADPGDVFWAASDIGWVVGHSFIVYGPLMHGCTTVLYEGKPVGTPDAGAFWRMVEDHKVNILFAAPTAFRAIKKEDPKGEFIKSYDISSMKALFLAGERADPDTLEWAEAMVHLPVIDHWWQTELGWPALATCFGYGETETKHGSAGRPVPGFDIQIVDEANQELGANETGDIVVKLPLPPGSLPTLWQNDESYVESYLSQHDGYYHTGDAGYIDEDGYVYVMSRTDDIINVAGHRLSTGAMEEVIAGHPDVAESAVLGAADKLKGQTPVALVVLNAGVNRVHQEIVGELVARVRQRIGPVAAFKKAAIVSQLPKTRSGKVLRGTLRKIADGVTYQMPATIEDPGALDVAKEALETLGLPES